MQPHDDAAVTLIQSPNVVVDFGADLLDADDHLIADLSPDLIDGKKDYQRDAQINNSCSIDILRPLDWKTARVRLWQSLSTGAHEVTVRVVDRPAAMALRSVNTDIEWSTGTLTQVLADGGLRLANAGDSWATKASMPAARDVFATGVIGTKIYVAGGYVFDTLFEYDSVANTWTTKASMPEPRAFVAGNSIGSKFYAVGGSWFGTRDTLFEYDPDTDSWATKPPMPDVRETFDVGVIGTKLYAVGGWDGSASTNTLYQYDQATNVWTTKASMPGVRDAHGVGVIGTKLYAVGGSQNGTLVDTLFVYDSVANTWATKASMPGVRRDVAVDVMGGKLYAVGGGDGSASTNTLYQYDPATDVWTTLPSMPAARAKLGIGVIGTKLYAVGGWDDGTGPTNTLFKYEQFSDVTTGNRISPETNLSNIHVVDYSLITWAETTPIGTSVAVDVSLDGGATWTAATSGQPIPGISAGDDLTGLTLLTRVTVTGSGALTAKVNNFVMSIGQAEISHETTETVPFTQRFNLGVFVLTTPVLNIGEDPISYSVTGFDKMQLLIHMVGDTYVIPAGLAYLYAVRQVITDSGYTGLLPLFDGAAQEKVLAEPMVFLDPAQYSWLDIVNAVLKAIGYRTLYADENGRYRSEPDKIPALRPPEYVFKVGDMGVGIVNPDRTYTADSFEDLNEWIFIREGMATRPVEGAGIYTVDRSAGGIRKPKVVRFTAADQDALVAQGNAQVADDTQSATTIRMTGGPVPFLGHLDVATISDGPIGDRKVIARSHTIQLKGVDTDMLWEVIDG